MMNRLDRFSHGASNDPSIRSLPGRLRLGRGDRGIPGRGRHARGRSWGEHLGPVQRRCGERRGREQRHRRVRLVPPPRRGHAPDARARPRRVPSLDRVAENPPRRDRTREPGRPRPLRPRRRRAAREWNRPVRDPLSLGSAAGPGGSGRLARARHGRGLRRVRGGRRGAARRSSPQLDHAERAVGGLVARLRAGRSRSRSRRRACRARRGAPRAAGARSGCGGPTPRGADREGRRDHRPRADVPPHVLRRGRRRGSPLGRLSQPLVSRPGARPRIPVGHARAVREHPPGDRGRRPRDDRGAARLPRRQLLHAERRVRRG